MTTEVTGDGKTTVSNGGKGKAAAAPKAKEEGKAKVDAKKLFQGYQSAEDAVTKAKNDLEAALTRRSDAVKAIKDNLGSGPFSWQGRTLTVTSRTAKDAPEGETPATTYFFKGIGGAVQTIE